MEIKMRKEFEFTEEQAKELIEALKPSPVLMLDSSPITQQDRSNAVWKRLGQEMGFIWHTARPIEGKGAKYFTAEVVEEESK